MKLSFEQNLIEVWRQALVENATVVELDGSRHPVRRTPKRSLRQVDFVFEGNEIRGLEQNPDTKSRIQTRSYACTLDHAPTFVMRTLPSGCPRTEILSICAAAYKPERKQLRLRSSVPTPETSKC